jgi:hypothetical protein
MKDLKELNNWTEKQLRTLRNNLNNRIESFKKNDSPKPLQASHILFNKTSQECIDLLKQVKKLLSQK